jgi:hypothetical protein
LRQRYHAGVSLLNHVPAQHDDDYGVTIPQPAIFDDAVSMAESSMLGDSQRAANSGSECYAAV